MLDKLKEENTTGKIKTIDVNAKEWYDKVNGNSYFAGTVIIDYQMESERRFTMPFQYGYESKYVNVANSLLIKEGVIPSGNDTEEPLWRYCEKNNIILRTNKKTSLKRELFQE